MLPDRTKKEHVTPMETQLQKSSRPGAEYMFTSNLPHPAAEVNEKPHTDGKTEDSAIAMVEKKNPQRRPILCQIQSNTISTPKSTEKLILTKKVRGSRYYGERQPLPT